VGPLALQWAQLMTMTGYAPGESKKEERQGGWKRIERRGRGDVSTGSGEVFVRR